MTPAAAIIFFTVFLDLIGFGIVLPLLPSYAARHQVSDAAVGALVASFSLMQFIFAPIWGRWSDRIGRRPILLIGLAGSAISYLIFAFARGFWSLLLSRVIAGGMGATVNVAQAYLADITPLERRTKAMGLIGSAFGLGFVVGPALGGISSRWGDAAPGLVASALTATNFLLAAWRLPESRVHRSTRVAKVPVHWSLLWEPFAVIGLTTVAFTVLYVVFPLQVERGLGYERHRVAYLFVMIGLVNAAVQGALVGRLVARSGERPLMVLGGVLLAMGLAGLGAVLGGVIATQPLPALLGSLFFVALGSGLIAPSATGLVSRVAPAEEQGRALGMLQGVAAVARVIGPLLAGLLTSHWGPRTAFLVAAGMGGIAAGVPVAARAWSPQR
jgi:multidrug resistance protein